MLITTRLPSGSSPGQKSSRERFVDDHDVPHLCRFLIGEEPSAFERDLHCLEVVLISHYHARAEPLTRRQLGGLRLDDRPACGAAKGNWQRARLTPRRAAIVSARSPAWKNSHPLLVGVILSSRQAHIHRQHVVCIEAGVNSLQSSEAADQQPGADEQYERQRDYQSAANSEADDCASFRRCSSALIEGFGQA